MSEHTEHRGVALVTGANKGIGRAADEQLTGRGLTVLLGARAAARQVEDRHGRLDVLVDNAGISGSGRVDVDAVRAVFETNVFGVIAVTNAALPASAAYSPSKTRPVASSTPTDPFPGKENP
jgi:NAD(P)-dependent dehydrogenase (short-subunit alcohol dehydrogenase family)